MTREKEEKERLAAEEESKKKIGASSPLSRVARHVPGRALGCRQQPWLWASRGVEVGQRGPGPGRPVAVALPVVVARSLLLTTRTPAAPCCGPVCVCVWFGQPASWTL